MPNQSFSVQNPNLQVAWDSTSLGLFKSCPRKYHLSLMAAAHNGETQGYETKRSSVHLVFGLHMHAAREQYDKGRAIGQSHEEALYGAIRLLLVLTWDHELSRPWNSDDKYKNRYTLIRTLVWYLDKFADDPFKTVILASGRPAVELSFRMETGYRSLSGEQFMLCGHLDRVAELNDITYIMDIKTTKNTINDDFFAKFTPDNQFSTYLLAAEVVYSLPVRALIVDAAQVAVTFSRFQRGMVSRTKGQLEEWHKDLGLWLGQAEHYAKLGYWPMNDKSCNDYGGCVFRGICSQPPADRQRWLETDYKVKTWDPLVVRGDI